LAIKVSLLDPKNKATKHIEVEKKIGRAIYNMQPIFPLLHSTLIPSDLSNTEKQQQHYHQLASSSIIVQSTSRYQEA
jgi:hypothetical protein